MASGDSGASAAFGSEQANLSSLIPVREQARISSVDVIRGVSLLGILLMNIVGMGLPDPAYWDPSGYGGDTGWNLRAWMITSLFFEGTMRAMFSMLFGAGVILFTHKAEKENSVSVADAWYRRTIWLFLFGLIHAYILLWPGEILYAYGLMGMFLFPFRNVRPKWLLTLGLSLLLVGAAVGIGDNLVALELYPKAAAAETASQEGRSLTPEQQEALEAWQEKLREMKPDLETREKIIAGIQGGYVSAMKTKAKMSFFMHTVFHYRYSYFDVLGMMFVGMALFKWRVFQAELPAKVYALMVLIGYAVALPVNWYETTTYMRGQYSLVTFYQVAMTYDLGRIFLTLGHIGLIMLFCQSGLLGWLKRSLAAVGRMALTNYISQTLITTAVFVGLGQFGRWERHQLYALVLLIWLVQLAISPIWLRHFYFGPMEWLWRSLTYQQRQPWLRR